MSASNHLRGSCSCGRYNYIVQIPGDAGARSQAHVHFGTGGLDHRSHSSLLSAWLRVPLTWYQSATVSFFPDERHDLIARTFMPSQQPSFQRKFCGFCGTHISYWTEEPVSEQDFMNITLGSLRERDLLALEDLDLLPEDADLIQEDGRQAQSSAQAVPGTSAPTDSTAVTDSSTGLARTSRSGTTGGISWFEDMIQGSQLGYHSKRRKGHGTSADGTTTVSWEISEYYDDEEAQPSSSTKRKAGDIETDDTVMKD